MRQRKKGQTEDIFSDLVVAIILIVITVAIIGLKETDYETGTSEVLDADKNSLRGIDLLTLLRMPATSINIESESVPSMQIDVTFAELLDIISQNSPERKEEFSWMFEEGDLIEDSDPLECEDGFVDLVTERLGYPIWFINLYDETDKMIFECSSSKQGIYTWSDKEITQIKTTIPLQSSNKNIVVEMVTVE